jgi:hypothetical protein
MIYFINLSNIFEGNICNCSQTQPLTYQKLGQYNFYCHRKLVCWVIPHQTTNDELHMSVYYNMKVGKYIFINGSNTDQLENAYPHNVPTPNRILVISSTIYFETDRTYPKRSVVGSNSAIKIIQATLQPDPKRTPKVEQLLNSEFLTLGTYLCSWLFEESGSCINGHKCVVLSWMDV